MLWGYRVSKYRQCLHPYGGSIYPYTVKMIQSTQINIKWNVLTLHNILGSCVSPTDIYIMFSSWVVYLTCIFVMCSVSYKAKEDLTKLDGGP